VAVIATIFDELIAGLFLLSSLEERAVPRPLRSNPMLKPGSDWHHIKYDRD
jgi:hypothetical protein